MSLLKRGFTLVELMVVISIIGVLSALVYANIGSANPKARDAERQADLRNLQLAIDQFKLKNGRYPEAGCGVSAGSIASENSCSTYISGLAPEFITVLPKDARRGSAVGYAYVTNDFGTSYKVMARGTVESETVTSAHPMKSCDTTDICNYGCGTAALRNTSYALWGGFAGNDGNTPAQVKTATALVICR